MINEVWKRIKNFPEYEVSNCGRIKSFKRKIPKILSLINNGNDYLCIKLCQNNRKHWKLIHRLVLETFNPIPNFDKLDVNHIDGNKENNKLENLEWVTRSENHKHAFKIGLKSHKKEKHPMFGKHHSKNTIHKMIINNKGVNNKNSKLKENEIHQILMLIKLGFKGNKISKIFNVTPSTISYIKSNKTWNCIRN